MPVTWVIGKAEDTPTTQPLQALEAKGSMQALLKGLKG